MADEQLIISETTFDGIKTSIKAFFTGQDTFKDYDFEGSNLTIIIDLLAKVALSSSFLGNQVAGEMFLSTAQLRKSAVKLAKHLNYQASSIRSSKMKVDVTGTGFINAYTDKFIGTINGQQYTYTSLSQVTLSGTPSSINLVEGRPNLLTFKQDYLNKDTFFNIPEQNVDTSTIEVVVKALPDSPTFELYTLATEFTILEPTSKVYFINEEEDGTFSVFFGDDVFGQRPANNMYVQIRYLVSGGKLANGINSLTPPSNVIAQTITQNASGGLDQETLESIKFRAPAAFQIQNRLITEEDYKLLLPTLFPDIESISVWGGEENVPPNFGTVYISLKSKTAGLVFNNSEKEVIKNIIKTKNTTSIRPIIVDPDFIFLDINCILKLDKSKQSDATSAILSAVTTEIFTYGNEELDKFTNPFLYSVLVGRIDNVNTAIISNSTFVRIKGRVENIPLQANLDYSLELTNPLNKLSIQSTSFKYSNSVGTIADVTIRDDGSGKLFIKALDSDVVIVEDIGTVDYVTGKIQLTSFFPAAAITTLDISGEPENRDITPINRQIITLDNITVTEN